MPSSGPAGTVFAVTASPGTTGTVSAPPASAPPSPIRQTAGVVVPAKPWSVVPTDTISRLPASIGATTPGSVTATCAEEPSAGTATRTGETAPPSSVRVPSEAIS